MHVTILLLHHTLIITRFTSGSGLVAELAESKKISKYGYLEHSHIFSPVAIETSGVCGPQSITFLKELGNRIKLNTGDLNSTQYLWQQLSIAIQRGNAASILGCMPHIDELV